MAVYGEVGEVEGHVEEGDGRLVDGDVDVKAVGLKDVDDFLLQVCILLCLQAVDPQAVVAVGTAETGRPNHKFQHQSSC